MVATRHNFSIAHLGPRTVPSPLAGRDLGEITYVDDHQSILYDIETDRSPDHADPGPRRALEKAGPRREIYFDPGKVHAAIVTCGGLCPGLNNVIRATVMSLWYHYGVRRISGIQFGYRGLLPEFGLPTLELTPENTADIHREGGTVLGASRGHGERTEDMIAALERMNVNILFVIGGDGTQKGAWALAQAIQQRGLRIAVVGIPKTIDNDLSFIQRSFGFETAVSEAIRAVSSAHIEAQNAINGIGIVKVMGRDSGFIAAHTALANNDVNYVLIPEVPFELDGSNGLLAHLKQRLLRRHHAVILVAEGAGQELMARVDQTDASGNRKLADIGLYLKTRISTFLDDQKIDSTVKYIDPSYMIRSAPANANDAIYCARLGTHAVHAAMAGKTGMLVSLIHDQFVHLPIDVVVSEKHRVDPAGELWRDVLYATGQPSSMVGQLRRRQSDQAGLEPSADAEELTVVGLEL